MTNVDPNAKSDNPANSSLNHQTQRTRPRWREILLRAKERIDRDNVTLVAAGVAFYMFLGSIPGLAAIVSIYGLVTDPERVREHFTYITSTFPQGMGGLEHQILQIAESQQVARWGAALSTFITLWAGFQVTTALIKAINMVYDTTEKRGLIKLSLLSLAFTMLGIAFLVLALATVAGLPALLQLAGLEGATSWILTILRWPLLILLFLIALTALYRYAPNRRRAASWGWISLGTITAAIIWIGGSLLLSLYVAHFGSFNQTYGSLGALAVLLLWFYLTSFAILTGAEFNAETERSC